METEDSVPCLQEPASNSYLELDVASEHSVPVSLRSTCVDIIVLYMPASTGWCFPSGFPIKSLYAFLISLRPSHRPCLRHLNIWSKLRILYCSIPVVFHSSIFNTIQCSRPTAGSSSLQSATTLHDIFFCFGWVHTHCS